MLKWSCMVHSILFLNILHFLVFKLMGCWISKYKHLYECNSQEKVLHPFLWNKYVFQWDHISIKKNFYKIEFLNEFMVIIIFILFDFIFTSNDKSCLSSWEKKAPLKPSVSVGCRSTISSKIFINKYLSKMILYLGFLFIFILKWFFC